SSRVDDILDLRTDALLVRWTNFGTARAGGGAFERRLLILWVFGGDGLVVRVEEFDVDREAEALARFDELTRMSADAPSPAATRQVRPNAATAHTAGLDAAVAARDANAIPPLLADGSEVAALARPNAASAAGDRWVAAYAASDWAAMRALYAPGATSEDRRRLVRLSLDVDWRIGDVQRTASMGNTRVERQLVGTAGDRVALERILLTGDPGGAAAASATESRRISNLGPFEIEFLEVFEVDESGRITGGVMFDVDDWRAASREA